MLPVKAYTIEGYYRWIVDSGCTPYLVVNTAVDHVEVPKEYVRHHQITLNMAPASLRELTFHPAYLSFLTQFAGVTHSIYVPMIAILSVYAKETGAGKVFEGLDEDYAHPLMQPMPLSHFTNNGKKSTAAGPSHLYIVE